MNTSTAFVLLGSGLLVAACGSSTPEAASPEGETDTTTAAAAPVEAPTVWSQELTSEQKMAFMVERVMPAMKPVFAQAPNFGCATCHGAEQTNAQAFAHPNLALPRLTFRDGNMTSFETNPDVSKFMLEKVVPAMAAAFGTTPYSADNPTGFGCGGCHGVDGM